MFHRPFTAETSAIIKHSLGASSTQHMWELLAGNHREVLPRHAREGGSGVTLIFEPVNSIRMVRAPDLQFGGAEFKSRSDR